MKDSPAKRFVLPNLRWWVLSLVVLITIINYLDRGTLSYMWVANIKTVSVDAAGQTVTTIHKGGIAYDLGLVDKTLSPAEADDQLKKLYSRIYMFFMAAYGISQLVSGRIYDRVGTRRGFVLSACIWSIADMLTSLARGVASLGFFRVLLGLGEAGPWPGTVKSNAEWFPARERALAQGLFGAGGSIGSILAPIVISLLFINFGWKTTFVIVGSLGLLWIIPWMIINRRKPAEHPWISDEEKKHILEGRERMETLGDRGLSWAELLHQRKSYAVILGRLFLDPIWWMFVAWLPIYLGNRFQLDIKQVAFSAWVPYVGASIGAIAGGWFSGYLMRHGKSTLAARRIAIVTGACITLPAMILAAYASTATVAVLLMAFILGGFQCAVVNIQTLPSDFHAGPSVGSLAGLGGVAAVIGTVCTMLLVPYITAGNNWFPFFVMGALLVPLALACVFFFSKQKLNEQYATKG